MTAEGVISTAEREGLSMVSITDWLENALEATH